MQALTTPLITTAIAAHVALPNPHTQYLLSANAGALAGLDAVDLSGAQATGVLAAGRFPGLTGDMTTIAGSLETTLATVNAAPGSFGSSSKSLSLSVNDKGLVTAAAEQSIQIVQSQVTGLGTALNAKADLVGGYVPANQLPPLVITDVFSVADESAMLALTAQQGDVAIRSDNDRRYINNGGTAGDITDWTLVNLPTDCVTSLAGMIGDLSLADVGAAASGGYTASRALVSSSGGVLQVSDVTAVELGYLDGVTSAIQSQLDSKVPLSFGGINLSSTSLTPIVAITAQSGFPGFYGTLSSNSGAFNNIFRRSRGTIAASTAVNNGDNLGGFAWQPHDGSAFNTSNSAQIAVIATENHSGSAKGTKILLRSTPVGGTSQVDSLSLAGTEAYFSGGLHPASMTDAAAVNNTIYYSTTASKLVYKDSGGVVNNLY